MSLLLGVSFRERKIQNTGGNVYSVMDSQNIFSCSFSGRNVQKPHLGPHNDHGIRPSTNSRFIVFLITIMCLIF